MPGDLPPTVTILIVPRERFSATRENLESVISNTALPFSLVYVDGNSPPPIRRYLQERAHRRGFTLVRTERYLTANEARNLGLAHVDTKYVVFLDNDVAVCPGWLDALVRCAEETGAGAVGPLYYIGDPSEERIHNAGAELKLEGEGAARRLREVHALVHRRAGDVRDQLMRRRTDLIEFHCALVRTDLVRSIGLDEGLLSYFDHDDLCLGLREAGATVYMEPRATVAYLAPPPLEASDVPFFLLRWSNAWLTPSARRFAEKHGIVVDDDGIRGHYQYRNQHRRRLYAPLRVLARRIGRERALAVLDRVDAFVFDRCIESTVVRAAEGRRTRV